MRTLQEKYNGVLEGNFSKTQFRRDAAIEMPQFVSTVNSFDDTVAILKNKGAITEAKKEEPKYSTAKPADTIAPDVLDTGIKFELDKKYGTLDVTPEQYEKCREMAIKNLSKDVLYYVKQDSIQLDEPGKKMEKAKLNEETDTLFARNLKATDHDYGKMFNALGDAVATGKGLEDASAEELKIYAQIALRLGDDIDVTNAFEYLENLPNYRPEFTPDNLRTDEARVKITDVDGKTRYGNGKDGKPEMSDKEAKEYIANAEKHGATPMGTKFEKTDEAIQNIENDEQTKRRIAGLTNQLLKDVDPRDEDHAVKAYAISVKNDLESGDASRLKRYKDLLSIDDLKDDMRHYISHDVDQLEETLTNDEVFDLLGDMDEIEDYAAGTGDLEKKLAGIAALQKKYGHLKDDPKLQNFFQDLKQAAKQEDVGKANGYISDAMREIEKLRRDLKEEDKDKVPASAYPENRHTLTPDELDERKALKEMFKKIITKVIND